MNTKISIAKAVGILTAAAVGDALGWPQENRSQIVGGKSARNVSAEPVFRSWERNGGGQYARYVDPVQAGEYSDDTQLLLAVARACLREDQWYEWLTGVELPIWPMFERGGGGAVLAASRSWADKRPPWIPVNARDEPKVVRYFHAGANGVAMRVAPHAIYTALADTSDLMSRVVRDGLTTHGHPRALIGACIHALAVRHALGEGGTLGYGDLLHVVATSEIWRQPDVFLNAIDDDWGHSYSLHSSDGHTHPADQWMQVVHEVDGLLSIAADELARGATGNDQRALSALGCFDKSQSGSGTVTAVAAIYVASRTAARPMSGLLRTAFLRDADTDTLCAMTGSLLGAIHGPDWLGQLMSSVQDRDYITDQAVKLAEAGNAMGAIRLPSQVPLATSSSQLRRWSDELFSAGRSDTAPDGRPWQIRDLYELPTKARSIITRVVGVTYDGQTLIHDKTSRAPSPKGRHLERKLATTAATEGASSREPSAVGQDTTGHPLVSHIASVELHVADLATSVRFFSEVLSLPVESGENRAKIGDVVILAPDKVSGAPGSDLGAVITVLVDDVEEVAARCRSFPDVRVAWSSDGAVLWVKEPGRNTVRIVPRPPHGSARARTRRPIDGPLGSLPSATPGSTGGGPGLAHMQGELFEAQEPPFTATHTSRTPSP